MDRDSLVSCFTAFCGPGPFKRFVWELNTTCRHKRRLLFWQEELWQRFVGSCAGEVPRTFPEIAEALRLCPVHRCRLKVGDVPVLHGLVVLSEDYRKARAERFPFAREVVLGGCCVGGEQSQATEYCEACREELKKWRASRMKMYILIKESVPPGFAILAAAHASLAAYLKFKDSAEAGAWLAGPFRKVVCKVTEEEFEEAKAVEDNVVLTESGLGGQEVAIAFRPREEWPKAFKLLRLYK